MAIAICNATGNFTGAATFAAAEAGALAAVLNRNTTTSIAAATTVTSVTFTVTNLKVIDAVLLWIKQTAAGSTGTLKVDLQKGGVSQASVTVNKADLPDATNVSPSAAQSPVPVLFKLTSTATGDGGSNWTIVLTTTGTGTLTINIASATTTNYTRALRTTTAATLATNDDVFVMGELTGAGTHTSYTVTMDSTAATVYGNGSVDSTTVFGGILAVSNYGTLSYGTTASTNYILRLAGDLRVYQFGTLNIGSSGAEIPRNSTAVLEFQQVSADGDFGLRCHDNATVTIAGLSRTSGKNVVKCKLTADVTSASTLTSGQSATNGSTSFNTALDATGTTPIGGAFTETTANATHGVFASGPSVTNTTQTATAWVARGTGTHNRYLRITCGNNTVQSSVTNGFYADVDMQAGTIGTCTAVGTGTATSASIVADGAGFIIEITGKVASGSATPSVILNSCSAAGTLSFVGVADQAFLFDKTALVTAASIADTTFNVDTDTGWLSGDTIMVASTSRTGTECQLYLLNANAGASSMTSAEYPVNTAVSILAFSHLGTAPFQAEVGLITRNVKVRSTSTTLSSYVWCAAQCSATFSWAEFSRIGVSGVATKRGLECDAAPSGGTSVTKSVTFCTMRDSDSSGFYINAGGFPSPTSTITCSNNVMWFNAGTSIFISSTITAGDWTFDNNLIMRGQSHGAQLNDIGGTYTNNTVVGTASGNGLNVLEGSATLGDFSNNTVHSMVGGFSTTGSGVLGNIDNLSVWRITGNNSAITISGVLSDLTFSDLYSVGNSGSGVTLSGNNLTVLRGTICSDTTFATTTAILVSSQISDVYLDSVDTSGVGTSLAACTNFMQFSSAASFIRGYANNCLIGPSTLISTRTNLSLKAFIGFEKYNQTAGDNRFEMLYGTAKTDTSIFHTASPAQRLTPNNASNKFESAPPFYGVKVPVANGTAVTASVYIRKSAAGDGAAYTGNQPRLIQRANSALGQDTDVVLATYSAGTGAWNQLSAASSTATDDGTWEFIVDCDGTAGWIDIDDWEFSGVATTALALKNWYNGIPNIQASGGVAGAYFSGGVGI